MAGATLVFFGLRRGGAVLISLADDHQHLTVERRIQGFTHLAGQPALPRRLMDVEVEWIRRHTMSAALDHQARMMEPALVLGRLVLMDEDGGRTPITKQHDMGWSAHLRARDELAKLLGCPPRSEETKRRQSWDANRVREAAEEASGAWGKIGPVVAGVILGAVCGGVLVGLISAIPENTSAGWFQKLATGLVLLAMGVGASVGLWVARTPRF